MQLLTRDAILKSSDLPFDDVAVPEWGGVVRVRGMSGRERDALEQQLVGADGKRRSVENFRARVVVMCAVDGEGKRLFTVNDVEALGAKSALALGRVFEAALRMSGLSPDDMADLEKNLEAGQSDDSTSA